MAIKTVLALIMMTFANLAEASLDQKYFCSNPNGEVSIYTEGLSSEKIDVSVATEDFASAHFQTSYLIGQHSDYRDGSAIRTYCMAGKYISNCQDGSKAARINLVTGIDRGERVLDLVKLEFFDKRDSLWKVEYITNCRRIMN